MADKVNSNSNSNSNSIPRGRVEPSQETMAYVQDRVANSKAKAAVNKSIDCEGVKVNVVETGSKDEDYLKLFLYRVKDRLEGQRFLFAIYRGPPYQDNSSWPLLVTASSPAFLRTAALQIQAKFHGRVQSNTDFSNEAIFWEARVLASNQSQRDQDRLWDALRSTPPPLSPSGSRTSNELFSAACAHLTRITPAIAHRELLNNQIQPSALAAFLVDIRTAAQRGEHGTIPGALHVERVELEARFDISDQEKRLVGRYDARVILFDQDGTASAFAAQRLHEMGLLNATDVIGGFTAWKEEGLAINLDLMSFPESESD